METKKDVKISFHTLIQRMWKDKDGDKQIDTPFYLVNEILEYIFLLPKKRKFYDLKDNKFCFLEFIDTNRTEHSLFISGFFKSARNEFRPNLLNRKTGNERPNPKEITEGDIEKTHFVIKIDRKENEVFMFLEHNFFGLGIKNIINYITHFTKLYLISKKKAKNFSIEFSTIPRNNFLTELEKLSRTKLAEVYFDKKLLGGKALNFSNRIISLKKDLKLIATASPKESIFEVAIDFFNAMNAKGSAITKVRIFGNDEDNNEIILDTSFMSRIEYISVDINSLSGELNTNQVISGLNGIAKSF
jgi:hypothetical protein